MAQQQTERTVDWGHWGITFCTHAIDEHGRRSYAPLEIHGRVSFPVGNCGPIDGTYGSPTRLAYQQMVRDWIDRGQLPAALAKAGA